jgi:hypothetical protein
MLSPMPTTECLSALGATSSSVRWTRFVMRL